MGESYRSFDEKPVFALLTTLERKKNVRLTRSIYFVRDDCKSTPPASGHPRNETLPRILGALVDPRTAEDRLVCQVCDTKYGRRDSEK